MFSLRFWAVTTISSKPVPLAPVGAAAFASAGIDPADTSLFGGFPGAFANDDSYYSVRHYHDRQASVFGELTFHVSPALALTAGLRSF